MAWHTRHYENKCSSPGCNKRAIVKVFDNFNCDYGPYCAGCGRSRVVRENKRLDEYNKFHRDKTYALLFPEKSNE